MCNEKEKEMPINGNESSRIIGDDIIRQNKITNLYFI